MNDAWRQADAEAHEAKAEALEHAARNLEAIYDAVDSLVAELLGQTVRALEHEMAKHAEAAKLVSR